MGLLKRIKSVFGGSDGLKCKFGDNVFVQMPNDPIYYSATVQGRHPTGLIELVDAQGTKVSAAEDQISFAGPPEGATFCETVEKASSLLVERKQIGTVVSPEYTCAKA